MGRFRAPGIMTMAVSLPRLLALGLAIAGLAVQPAHAAEPASPGGAGQGSVPRFRHDKDLTCAERAHQRVRALLDGVPWPRSDGRPVAGNRHCG
jgi:hypothetical protein